MQISHYFVSKVGKVRNANEDACGYEKTVNGDVFVVCDGMGGHVGGAMASQLGVKSIMEFFNRVLYDNVILSIDRAFQFANEQIFAHTLEEPALKGMGTTIALLLIRGDDCYIGHIGDSRIYLKTDDELHRITKDHSFVQQLVDQKIITDDQAKSHPKKNQILKALGHSVDVQGTICQKPLRVKAGDVFLLCTDGLNGMISDNYISRYINFADLQESGKALYNAAMDNRGADNITLFLVRIDESSHTGSSDFISLNPATSPKTDYFLDNTKRIKKKQSKEKRLALVLLPFLLAFALVITYLDDISSFFKHNKSTSVDSATASNDAIVKEDLKNKDNKSTSIDSATASNDAIVKEDLKNKDLKEIKNLVSQKRKVKNISNGYTFKTKDNKRIELVITDGRLEDVKEIVTDSSNSSQNDDANPDKQNKNDNNPTYQLQEASTIQDLIPKLKKLDNILSEEEILKLNSANLNKLTGPDKLAFDSEKKIPKGFKLKYKIKKKRL
jgi:serine/threonine protein phosphatase PrpC